MARFHPVRTYDCNASSRFKSILGALATIGGSTVVSFLIADAYLTVERYRRGVAADLHAAMNWLAGLDALMVAGVVAAVFLAAIVLVARRMA